MEIKKHYKLFKNGKLWCTMAIASVAMVAGLAVAPTTQADATTGQAATPTPTNENTNPQSPTTTNQQEIALQPAPATKASQQTNNNKSGKATSTNSNNNSKGTTNSQTGNNQNNNKTNNSQQQSHQQVDLSGTHSVAAKVNITYNASVFLPSGVTENQTQQSTIDAQKNVTTDKAGKATAVHYDFSKSKMNFDLSKLAPIAGYTPQIQQVGNITLNDNDTLKYAAKGKDPSATQWLYVVYNLNNGQSSQVVNNNVFKVVDQNGHDLTYKDANGKDANVYVSSLEGRLGTQQTVQPEASYDNGAIRYVADNTHSLQRNIVLVPANEVKTQNLQADVTNINFVNMANNQVVQSIKYFAADGTKYQYVVNDDIPTGYTLQNQTKQVYNLTFSKDMKDTTIELVPNDKRDQDLTRTVTRTIHLVSNGKDIPGQKPVKQTVTFTRSLQNNGGVNTYTAWKANGDAQWAAYDAPTVAGYVADSKTAAVPPVTVTADTKNAVVDINYTPLQTKKGTPRSFGRTANGKICYYGSDGIMYQNRFLHIFGHYYYYGNDGGLVTSQTVTLNPAEMPAANGNGALIANTTGAKTYWFDADGIMQQNKFHQDRNGHIQYFARDGHEFKNEWYYNWGQYYFFGADGNRYTDQFLTTGKGEVTNLVPNGVGGTTTDNNNHVFYFNPSTGILLQNHFFTRWGKIYYFGQRGMRYTDQFFYRWGHKYYYGDDGALVRGRGYDGPNLAYRTIDGNTYAFNRAGIAYTGLLNAWGKVYYFGNDGARYSGYHRFWGQVYFFGTDGVRYTNQFYYDTANQALFYYNHNGVQLRNGTVYIGNHRFYAGNDGRIPFNVYAAQPGLTFWANKDDNGGYYFADGQLGTNGMQTVINRDNPHTTSTYYFINGVPQSGFQMDNGRMYYFSPSDYALITNRTNITIGNNNYDIDSNGVVTQLNNN